MARNFLNCLTSKQFSSIHSLQENWQRIVFSTEPIEQQKTIRTIKAFYNLNGKKEPKIIFCNRPWSVIWQLINYSKIYINNDLLASIDISQFNSQIFDFKNLILALNQDEKINIDGEIYWHLVKPIIASIQSVKALLLEQLCSQLKNKIYYEFVSESKSEKKKELLKKNFPIEEIAYRVNGEITKKYIKRSQLFSKKNIPELIIKGSYNYTID